MARDWRKHVNPELREYLEKEVRATFAYKKAYDNADNKGNAQLWIALANMAKQLNQLQRKYESVEQSLRELEDKARGMPKQEISFVEDDTAVLANLPEPEMPEMPSLAEMKELENVDELLADMKPRKKAGRKPGRPAGKKLSKGKKLKKSLKRF